MDYLSRHIEACAVALARGTPLAGCLVWSLVDSFESVLGLEPTIRDRPRRLLHQQQTLKASAAWLRSFLRYQPPWAGSMW